MVSSTSSATFNLSTNLGKWEELHQLDFPCVEYHRIIIIRINYELWDSVRWGCYHFLLVAQSIIGTPSERANYLCWIWQMKRLNNQHSPLTIGWTSIFSLALHIKGNHRVKSCQNVRSSCICIKHIAKYWDKLPTWTGTGFLQSRRNKNKTCMW